MDVEHQLVQIPLTVNQSRLIPALPQRPGSSPAAIERPAETSPQGPHGSGKGYGGRSHREVKMIPKETPRENLEIVSLLEFSQ